MNIFLERYNKIKSWRNGPLTSQKIESVVKSPPPKKSPYTGGLTAEFYQTFKEYLILILFKIFQKLEEEEYIQILFIRAILPWYQA
jgi:hypothetical protein